MSTPLPAMRFSSADVPQAQRTAYVRDVLADAVMGVDLHTVDGSTPELALAAQPLSAGIAVMEGTFGRPVQAMRGQARVASDGIDSVFLVGHRAGAAVDCEGLDRERIAPGQLMMGTLARPANMIYDRPGDLVVMSFDRAALRRRVPHLDADAMRLLAPDAPGTALVQSYARLLLRAPPATAGAQWQAGEHLADLAALLLGARGDAAEAARAGGGRAARLAAIRADVERAYRDPQLSVAHLAQRHHMSVRQVQRLFEEDGATFTAHVQNCRLEHVRRLLASPAHAHLLVASIAYEAGFSDLAAFNRLFKQRYGATPTQVRAGEAR